MTGGLGVYLVFILGIIVGGILFSKDFREKFFRRFRRFLAGVGKGRTSGTRTEPRSTPRHLRDQAPPQENEYEPAPRSVPKPKIIDCPICNGVGKVQGELPPLMKGGIGIQEKWVTCPTCEGSGRVYEKSQKVH